VITDLAAVEHSTFSGVVGESFGVTVAASRSIALELVAVRVLGSKRVGAARDPFALEFRGPSGLRLPQGIYRFDHGRLGVLEIFISQTGDGEKGSEFEAIFS
jgi:hypothetical protein